MKKWLIVALAGLAAGWVGGRAAVAQQPGPPAAAGTAESLFEQASGLAQEGRESEAIALLEAAIGPDSPPQLAALLGALYVDTARPGDALRALRPLADAADAGPAVLYNAGRAALAAGDPNLGRSYLERSVAAEQGTPAARELGLLRAQAGQFLDAYVLLKPWSASRPDDRQARLVAALCAVQLERPDEALALLDGLAADDPQVALLRAKAWTTKADYWAAIAALEPVVDHAPAAMQLDVASTLAAAKAAIGQSSEAVALLIDRVGDDPVVALQLAQAQFQSGDAPAALATLAPFADRALPGLDQGRLPPGTSPQLIIEYGRVLATLARPAEALPFLRAATRLAPDNKQTWHQLGQALASLGRTDEALEALDRFQQLVATEAPASMRDHETERGIEDPTGKRLRQAMLLVAEERLDEALEIVQQEAALASSDIRPFLLEARILLSLERFDEALERTESLVAAADASADAHYIHGAVLFALDRVAEAEGAFRQALERSAEHTAAMNDLAVVLMRLGKTAEARVLLERALELRPEDPLAAANLRQLDESR